MKISKLLLFALGCLFVASLVTAADPPALTDFHQFYGKVTDLPSNDTFKLKAKTSSSREAVTSIDKNGNYGLSSTFKVYGKGGDKITFFVVNNLGSEIEVGKVDYKAKDVTNKEFKFDLSKPKPKTSSGSGSKSSSKSNETSNESSDRDPSTFGEGGRVVDNQASNQVPVVEDTDPIVVEETTPTQVCTPFEKRCFGDRLEECTLDGSFWQTKEICEGECDIASLTCKDAPKDKKPILPLILITLGILIGVGIIGGLVYYFVKVKGLGSSNADNPQIRSYIGQARNQGESDAQIRRQMLSQGWDAKDVDNLLKK